MPRPRGLSIGELAAASGVNLETVRYYERIGLMPAPARTEGGHRAYEPEHRARLEFIRRGRELGFPIDDIRALLDLSQSRAQPCEAVRAIAADHLATVQAKIADLTRLEAILAETVSQCGGSADPSCPVLEMLEGAA
ncbi:MAG: MerR family transcriptional regulator [Phenylobacterium sp.]|nr:MAG: MerR family transcriptional regulator [Phenylobacterium sp.]